MKLKNKKSWAIGLSILGLAAIAAPTFALTSCGHSLKDAIKDLDAAIATAKAKVDSFTETPAKNSLNAAIAAAEKVQASAKDDTVTNVDNAVKALKDAISSSTERNDNLVLGKVARQDKVNKDFETNNDLMFDENKHGNVNIATLAAGINAAQIHHFKDFAQKPAVKPFFDFLATKSVLVINAQVPSTKWPRVDENIHPGTKAEFIDAVQKNFIVMTPQVYSLTYTSPSNSEAPGFGMKFPVPTDEAKKQELLGKYWRGEILGSSKRDTNDKSQALFDALKGSVDLVIYMYPAGAQWIADDIKAGSAQLNEALKPLLTETSAKKADKAIIAESIDTIYNPLFSNLGTNYLQQMFVNGLGYKQSNDGVWTQNPAGNWGNNLTNFYEAFAEPTDSTKVDAFKAESAKYTPYFDISKNDLGGSGIDLVAKGYAESTDPDKVTWPFANKYIQSLTGKKIGTEGNTNTFSIYYNATDSLISLGFVPTFSSYIYDPIANSHFPKGLLLNSYVTDWYPNIISNHKIDSPEDGKIIGVPTSYSGIKHHGVEPIVKNIKELKVNTMFAPDFVMEKTGVLYSDGHPVVDRIVYGSHGDFTIDGQSFFNKNNMTAAFNTIDGAVKSTNTGYYPQNLLDVQLTNADGTTISFFDKYLTSSDWATTADYSADDKPNSIMATYRNLQWFANQIAAIKGKDFQISASTHYYLEEADKSFVGANSSDYEWNITNNKA